MTKYLCQDDILDLIEGTDFYDTKEFTYDYDFNHTLYKGKKFEPKLQSAIFCRWYNKQMKNETGKKLAWRHNDFKDTVYTIARMNTPEQPDDTDILIEPIEEWLTKTNKTEVRVLEIIKEVFAGKFSDYSNRKLETRIGLCLRKLNFKKVRRNYGSIWVLQKKQEEEEEVDILIAE